MADRLYDYIGDPFNNDAITEYKAVNSTYYSGNYSNITAPASPNYPINTPARYFIKMPLIPYTEDYATYPMTLRDVTGGVNLTRVTGTPGTNQYRVAPNTSRTPDVIELNSSQAGKEIGYSYYGIGSVLHTDNESESYLTKINATTLISNNTTETSVSGVSTKTISGLSILTYYKKIKLNFELKRTVTIRQPGLRLRINGLNGANDYRWSRQGEAGYYVGGTNPTIFEISSFSGTDYTKLFYEDTTSYISQNDYINGEIEFYKNSDNYIIYSGTIYNDNDFGIKINKVYGRVIITQTDLTSITLYDNNSYNFSGKIFTELKKI